MKFKKHIFIAFTLAEVLITLGIIGVVAALTIPAIIQKTENLEYKTAYKKAYSDFNQAFLQAIFDNSLTSRTNKFDANATDSEWLVIKDKFKITLDCDTYSKLNNCWADGDKVNKTQPSTTRSLSFIDGSGRSWAQYINNENIYLVDTNGFKNPNLFGKDRWLFTLRNLDNTRVTTGLPAKVGIYSGDWNLGIDILSLEGNWCTHPPCYYYSWLND